VVCFCFLTIQGEKGRFQAERPVDVSPARCFSAEKRALQKAPQTETRGNRLGFLN